MKFRIHEGQEVEVDPADLRIGGNLVEQANGVCARIGQLAEAVGYAQAARDGAETAYRHWRSIRRRDLKEEKPKFPAHMLDSAVEADPEFDRMKRRLAQAEAKYEMARGYLAAFREKAGIIRSLLHQQQQTERAENTGRIPVRR